MVDPFGWDSCANFLISQIVCIILYGSLLMLSVNNVCYSRKSAGVPIEAQFPEDEDESVKRERDRVKN